MGEINSMIAEKVLKLLEKNLNYQWKEFPVSKKGG